MLQKVGRAAHAKGATVQHMRIDHCGFDVFVAHELLKRADVLAAFQQVGGERMAEGVGRGWRGDSRGEHRPPHGLLNHGGIQVMASLLTGVGAVPAMLLWKYPLPAPLHRCMGILPPQGVGKAHPPKCMRSSEVK